MSIRIVAILDRSGSMGSIKSDAIHGFNEFLETQKKNDNVELTLVLFDDKYEKVFDGKPIADVEPLTDKTYVPRGMTALNDAVGRTLSELFETHEKTPFDGVIICILTDGEENCSKEYNLDKVKSLINDSKEKYKWETVYLAANQDAFSVAKQYGFTQSSNFDATKIGTRQAYATIASTVTNYVSSVSSDTANK